MNNYENLRRDALYEALQKDNKLTSPKNPLKVAIVEDDKTSALEIEKILSYYSNIQTEIIGRIEFMRRDRLRVDVDLPAEPPKIDADIVLLDNNLGRDYTGATIAKETRAKIISISTSPRSYAKYNFPFKMDLGQPAPTERLISILNTVFEQE